MMSFFPKIQPLKPSPSPWFADLRLVELQLLILLMRRGSEMQSWTGSIRWHRLQVLTILVSWCKTYRGWDRPWWQFFNLRPCRVAAWWGKIMYRQSTSKELNDSIFSTLIHVRCCFAWWCLQCRDSSQTFNRHDCQKVTPSLLSN